MFCVIIGVTFIISGFTKAVDPFGTAIKFNEYFAVYGFEFMLPLSRILAIWLCGAEMMMGCMMLFRVRLRLISIFALCSMILFTVITALSVSLLPVEDCGCFGDALYLTPVQTLIKNLIILPMVITIWWRYRPDRIFAFNPREVILSFFFFIATMSFSAYNYFHLPLIDFLPYKVGVNLLEQVESTDSADNYSVVLVYRNIASGELREFSVDDTQWQDSNEWEWVETRTDAVDTIGKSMLSDFSLLAPDGENVTVELLSSGQPLNLLTITSLDQIRSKCRKRIAKYIKRSEQRGAHTIIATPQLLAAPTYSIDGYDIECYNIDPTTMKSLMRANVGVVEFSGGIIQSKRSCIDL